MPCCMHMIETFVPTETIKSVSRLFTLVACYMVQSSLCSNLIVKVGSHASGAGQQLRAIILPLMHCPPTFASRSSG